MEEAASAELEIQLVKGDITQQNVDVIVNVVYADDTDVCHAAERILQVGGKKVQADYHKLQTETKIEPGIVHYLPAGGDLKAKNILLIALPDIGPAPSTCNINNVISSTVLACLRAAENFDRSIVFPIIGIELYPPDVIARCMFEAVLDYEEERKFEKDQTLETTVFAIYTGSETYDEFVLQTFKEQYQTIYDADSDTPEPVDQYTDGQDMDETDSPACFSRPQIANSIRNSSLMDTSLATDSWDPPYLSNQSQSQLPRQLPRQLPPIPKNEKKKKKIKRKRRETKASIYCPIVVGNIARQIADVIVCSVGESLDLSKATASNAVLKVGGKDLQRYLKEKYPRDRKPPEIATIAKSGELQCEDVYCVVLSKEGNVDHNMKDLETVIMECLIEADKTKRNSLAFPALGTGKLKKQYPVDAVAKCMFKTVQTFSSNHQRTSINSVLFVLRETDTSVQEAFREESKRLPPVNSTRNSMNTVACSCLVERYPKTWQPMEDENFMMVKLDQECQEYEEILNRFKSSMLNTKTEVITVERIQNAALYIKYEAAKQCINRKNPNIENERTLWHGTNCDVVQSICINGFNRSYCGKNGTNYGKGTYFAKHASYSNDYTSRDSSGYRCMFLTCVITGKFTQGNASMNDVPNISSSNNCEKYDCTVDNSQNPTIFVCFTDNHTYPQYLLTYKLEESSSSSSCSLM